jgi:3-hydroxyacyl-CoA dehydrogenase/enoyl-CoA hydratase/3-hydroxybutyryl-CoA epimerase
MSEQHANEAVKMRFDPETGIATLTLAMPKVNVINASFGTGLHAALEWAKGHDALKGIIIDSAHKDFCAGADLESLWKERDVAALDARVRDLCGLYREIETCGVPVVAALTGSALGGGYELALACHHRVALNDPRVKVGLPEVQLGVMPGAGGTQRLPRLIGIQAALEIILAGADLRAPKAVGKGLVDTLADTPEAVRAAAEAWIAENPRAKQPWDEKKLRIPGPRPGSADARNILMAAAAMLSKRTAGAFLGPQRALSAVQEGIALDFDSAMRVESRYFVELATGDQAKDMIRTLWFYRNAASKHVGLVEARPSGFEKVTILGAGMMGAGLAYVSADAGMNVVLKDIQQDALDAGVTHFETQLKKRKKHLDEAGRAEIRERLTGSLSLDDVEGSDLIIEAVFENLELKHTVTEQTEPRLAKDGVWASNTSALPITDLAKASAHPERFIGLHFFSPVEKMPLLEIIVGEQTSDETLARCLDYCRAIKKLPIVVNDGYGFYTTRVFSAYILEGAQLVAEGHDPVLIEWAARQAGMVVPPLQVFDEVTLTLGVKAMKQGRKYAKVAADLDGFALLETMVDTHGRGGKAAGAGFYEYENGRRKRLWSGLSELTQSAPEQTGVDIIADRLLLAQANQAAHAVAEGVIRERRDAEVGAIFGIGFAPNTGGPLSWIDRRGVARTVADLDALAASAGPRFAPPEPMRQMAQDGETYLSDPV